MISVIIPLYNKEKDIRATIRSVLEQSFRNFELIVVNDGSTDGSADIVREEMLDHSNILLIDQPNQGVSAARNRGIREAKGDYVALIDGDDIWEKDCLRELVQMTVDFPDAAMCGVNYAYIMGGGNYTTCQQGLPEGFRDYVKNYFASSHNDLFCSSSVIVHRGKAISVGLFDEHIKIAEDLDLWYRIIYNYPVAFYNKALSYYNLNAFNRVEENRDAHFEITQRMDYYIEKFVPCFSENKNFARFIGMRVAFNLLRGGYYFGNKHDRTCSDQIVKFLPYRDMPYKYRLIFKTPRSVGWLVYKLTLLKKRLFSKK